MSARRRAERSGRSGPSSSARSLGWRVGIDLGGTWLRVAAADARGRRRSVAVRAPAPAELPDRLRSLWKGWRLDRRDVDVLVVASRGVWTAAERARLARRLRALASSVRVLSDAEAAYHGALSDAPGVLILAGTGSMALGRAARGRWARAGGLGPLLGDEGSAFWIGREWLRASTRKGDLRTVRRMLAAPQPVARVAALALLVLRRARARSPRARAIVARAQDALAALIAATVKRLALPGPVATSWSGGLLDDAAFRAGIWRAAHRRGLALRPVRPAQSAVDAALRLASQKRADEAPGGAGGRPRGTR